MNLKFLLTRLTDILSSDSLCIFDDDGDDGDDDELNMSMGLVTPV